jgi:hypothetical protein
MTLAPRRMVQMRPAPRRVFQIRVYVVGVPEYDAAYKWYARYDEFDMISCTHFGHSTGVRFVMEGD